MPQYGFLRVAGPVERRKRDASKEKRENEERRSVENVRADALVLMGFRVCVCVHISVFLAVIVKKLRDESHTMQNSAANIRGHP